MNFGQTCHAGTRIYVHEDVYDKFLEAYTAVGSHSLVIVSRTF